jgi:tricarballylate dehydrogenase
MAHRDAGGDLARFTIEQSKELWDWMNEAGVRFQKPLGGTLNLGRTNAFFLGGGRAMLNALYDTAEHLGVEIRYDTAATSLDIEDGFFKSAVIEGPDGTMRVHARSLVTAAGGFESNIEWLK